MRSLLPAAALAILALAGCATPLQKAARAQQKIEHQQEEQDTRATEQRRRVAVENGDVNSKRGAEIYMADRNKSFDPNTATATAKRSFGTGKAQTKDFYSGQPVRKDTFKTQDFYDSKANQAAERKFATKDVDTKNKFLFLFARKTAPTKTAATKESPDAQKTAPTRTLADGKRRYLGPDSKKLNQQVAAKDLADWRHGGGESVGYTDTTVERVSTLKQLSIDDIRNLLNKDR